MSRLGIAEIVIRRGVIQRLDAIEKEKKMQATDEVEELRQRVRRAERERLHYQDETHRLTTKVGELERELMTARARIAVVERIG